MLWSEWNSFYFHPPPLKQDTSCMTQQHMSVKHDTNTGAGHSICLITFKRQQPWWRLPYPSRLPFTYSSTVLQAYRACTEQIKNGFVTECPSTSTHSKRQLMLGNKARKAIWSTNWRRTTTVFMRNYKTSNIYFICSLFSNAFSVTQTIVSNEGMISKWWSGKDLQASSRSLILCTILAAACRN
jgi:hypothetical protein